MSQQPRHRGPAPEDVELFDPRYWPQLRGALSDLGWLLDHGYAMVSSSELVGNRYELTSRQRMAVVRCACSTAQLSRRHQHQVDPSKVPGQELWLDGFNVLLAVEVALAGGVILLGHDGCCRDVAGVHAHYHRVEETLPAMRLIGEATHQWGACQCRWFLDRPVSNSGRLRELLEEQARLNQWTWTVELVMNPDKVLRETDHIVATADSVILDACQRWVNLAWIVIGQSVPQARMVDLSGV